MKQTENKDLLLHKRSEERSVLAFDGFTREDYSQLVDRLKTPHYRRAGKRKGNLAATLAL